MRRWLRTSEGGGGDRDGTDEPALTVGSSSPDSGRRGEERERQRATERGKDADARGEREAGADDTTPDEDDIFPAVPETDDDPEGDWAHVTPIIGTVDETPEEEKTVTKIEIPARTILVVIGTLSLIWLLLQVWTILLLVFLAFLLSLALLPPVRRVESHGSARVTAVGLVFLVLIGAIAGFFFIVVPPLVDQGQNFVDNAPTYLTRFERIIARYPELNRRYQDLQAQAEEGGNLALPWSQILSLGSGFVAGIANLFFVSVLTFYLLLEGERTYRFLARYFTPELRFRMRRAFPELTRVVSGFVIGQLITSLAFGIFAFVVLTIAGVPEPLLLAVIAGVFDAVPIVGVPAAMVPAALLALTVSVPTAIIVLSAYIIYQQIENYVLVPRVYGNTLQVSSLSILVGVLVGGQLLGVIGVILALPITAAIPVIERIWVEPVPDDLSHEEL